MIICSALSPENCVRRMQAHKAATVEGLLKRKNAQAHDEAAATALLGREVLGRRAKAGQACESAAMAWRLYEHQRKLLEVRAEAVLQALVPDCESAIMTCKRLMRTRRSSRSAAEE